jgi:RHH-type transcriptional regulator, rel operon repressor / antitoxin RelB
MGRVLNIRLDDEIADRLESLSKKTHRPKSFYVRDMIIRYLEDYEDACLALDRLNKKNARYMTMEEVENKIGL